jgi:hypothetical protein
MGAITYLQRPLSFSFFFCKLFQEDTSNLRKEKIINGKSEIDRKTPFSFWRKAKQERPENLKIKLTLTQSVDGVPFKPSITEAPFLP